MPPYGATTAGPEFSIYVTSLDSPERRLLLHASSSNVVYSHGNVLFLRDATLMAQPFDARQVALTREAFPVAEQIHIQGSTNTIGVSSPSEGGAIAYQSGGPVASRLMWFDRHGASDRAGAEHRRPQLDGWAEEVSVTFT